MEMANNSNKNNTASTSTSLSKRSLYHHRRRPLKAVRKMFQNRRKAKQRQNRRDHSDNEHQQHLLVQHQQQQQYVTVQEQPRFQQQQQISQPRRGFSIRKKNNNVVVRCESPPRPARMPKEIKITPGTPDSNFSAISGATGLHTTDNQFALGGRSMFKSVLPEMTSETEECSLDRSTASWASRHVKNKMGDSGNGSGSGGVIKKSRDASNSGSSKRSSIGGFMIGGSSRSLLSDDSEFPSRDLFKSPTKVGKTKHETKSFLSRSKTFKNIINYTFDSIDIDNSGTIDKKEIYSGFLLIHLKLAAYVGPAACRPVDKEYVFKMFDTLDVDNSGSLNREEFTSLMTILCSQITTRVFMQLLMTLMIVPFLSQYLVDIIKDIYHILCLVLAEIDDAEVVSEFIWSLVLRGWDFVLSLTPPIVQRGVGTFTESLSDSFLDTMPLTIMSCSLGCIIVPWLLYKCDDFYSRVAVKRSSIIQT